MNDFIGSVIAAMTGNFQPNNEAFTSSNAASRNNQLLCEFCDRICRSKAGLTMHRQQKHSDMLVPIPLVPAPALANACTLCDMSFSTKVGLTQHKRHRHSIEYNAEKLNRIKPSTQRRNINRPMPMESNDANAPIPIVNNGII